jgi:hypothetical protein
MKSLEAFADVIYLYVILTDGTQSDYLNGVNSKCKQIILLVHKHAFDWWLW